jgi:hypothetical protein
MTDNHYICACGAEYLGPCVPDDDYYDDEIHDFGCTGPWRLVPDWFTDPAADVLNRFAALEARAEVAEAELDAARGRAYARGWRAGLQAAQDERRRPYQKPGAACGTVPVLPSRRRRFRSAFWRAVDRVLEHCRTWRWPPPRPEVRRD